VAEAAPVPDEIPPDAADAHGGEQPTSESALTPAERQELLAFSRLPHSTRKIAGRSRRLGRLYKLSNFLPRVAIVRTTKPIQSGVARVISTPRPDPTVAAAVDAANRVERQRIAGEKTGKAKPLH
jgi:hypothetical protein